MASPIRGGTIETEFRAISGRETIPMRTPVSAESTAHVASLPSNATAIPVYQVKCLTKVIDKLIYISDFFFIRIQWSNTK